MKNTREQLEQNSARTKILLYLQSNNLKGLFASINALNFDVNTFIIDYQNSYNILHVAAKIGNNQLINFLCNQEKTDVNKEAAQKYTALHIAVLGLHRESVELLLQKGANVNAQTIDGFTPLALNAEKGWARITELLVQYQPHIDLASNGGLTPFTTAMVYEQLDVAKILLKAGADIEARDKCDWTPLCTAVKYDKTKSIKFLLENNADTEAQVTNEKLTACHIGAQYQKPDAVKLLKEHGADINKPDALGYTPIFFAALNQNIKLLEYFIINGADISIRNCKGRTPSEEAQKFQKTQSIDFLNKISVHEDAVNDLAEERANTNLIDNTTTSATGESNDLYDSHSQ